MFYKNPTGRFPGKHLGGAHNMATATEEKKTETEETAFIPIVKNEADNPDDLSVTTITPFPEKADSEKVVSEKESLIEKDEKETVASDVEKESKENTEESGEVLSKTEKVSAQKKDDPVQKRINEITRKRREAERELEYERKKRIEAEREVEKFKNTIPATDKPKMEAYQSEEEYLDALTDWKIERKLKTEQEKSAKESIEKSEKASITALNSMMENSMNKGAGKYEDFSEVVLDDNLKITEAMTDTIVSSEIAEEILYFLGKNPDVSETISKMEDLKAAREIGKIEAKLLAPQPRKKTSTAPTPITPIQTTGMIEKSPDIMSMGEYRRWRLKK